MTLDMIQATNNINKNSERSSLFLIVLLACILGLAACQPEKPDTRQHVFSGPIMGTDYRVTVVSNHELDNALFESLIVNAMESVNQSMSNYLPDSEINQFNRLSAKQSQKLSADLLAVVNQSLDISKLSDGAFDITLAEAINAWGFGPDGEITKRPVAKRINELKATVGFDKLLLNNGYLSKAVDELQINVSAIAKGYAVDKVAAALEFQGVSNYLINIGGELRASGLSINDQLWRVGIEKPQLLGGIQEIVVLNNASIATSGDYRNYHIVDGQRFSHTIDPNSLSPVYHKLALVSVISQTASMADALATSMMAMDEERAWRFAQSNNLAAYLAIRGDNDGEYVYMLTKQFKAYLQ